MASSPSGTFVHTSAGKKDANGLPADLDLSMDMIRVFVTNNQAGLYGE